MSGGAVVQAAAERGLLINSPREDSLRFMPALNITTDELDLALELLDRALTTAAGSAPPGV